VGSSEVDRFCERLEADISDHRAVRWVETVSEVGRVVVAFDKGAASEEDFIECVEDVEEEFGVQEEPFAGEAVAHAADVEPIVRGAVEITGSAVGLGIATAQRAARVPPIPYVSTAAGGLAFLEHQPRARRLIEHVMGGTPAELMLSLTNGVAQASPGHRSAPWWTWGTGQRCSRRRRRGGG
jgi:hypothetical protein